MTFLNAILALGALAFTVPLAIHLLFRSRFRTIDWGAMHLLDSVVRINRRRLQLMQLLLLMLRCLVPVLLAFCLARPLLTGFQSLPGDAARSLVIAIDDSRSMAARDETGASRMDRVKQQLGEMFARLSRRDEVILIRSSQVDSPAPAMGAQEAVRQLRQLRTESGPVDIGRLVRAAIEAADDAAHPQRHVIIASDFQSSIVNEAAIESLRRFSSRLAERSIRPVVSFLDFGVESDKLENVSVESIEIDSPAVVAGRGARFSAQLRNASDTPVRDLRIVWSINGKPLSPTAISLAPRSTATSRLSRSIDQVGVHQLSLSIEHGDALVEDNRRSIGVDVIREINVLLVDGQPSSRPLEGETDFLAIALSPFAFGGQDQPDAVRTNVVRISQVTQQLEKSPPDIVILANVNSPGDEARKALAQFVLDGGSLVVFDGDQIQPEAYNQSWECDAGSWSLPAQLGNVVGSDSSAESAPGSRSQSRTFSIGARNAQYSPWDVLGTRDQRPFGDVEVLQYRQLKIDRSQAGAGGNPATNEADIAEPDNAEPTVESTSDDGQQIASAAIGLLRFSGGDPMVVSARRGRGSVVQFAVPCDASWTNLPTRLVYLPMMQQLVLDLAGSRKQTTIDVGQDFSVQLAELASQLPADLQVGDAQRGDSKQAKLTVELPSGVEVPLEATDEAASRVVVSTTAGPGVYRVRQSTPIEDEKPLMTSTLRVVEVPRSESQLRDADAARLAATADLVDANIYEDLQTLQQDDRTRRYGREIWRWLLMGLLGVMIAELFVQQRTLRGNTVGAS